MKDLERRYAKKETTELIEILERPEGFTKEALGVASRELKARKLDSDYLSEIAETIKRQQLQKLLDAFDPLNDPVPALPASYFFKPKQVKAFLLEEFEKFIRDKEGFRIDVMKYSIGAII
ncbi:MAG: hypothetical protein GYB31_20560 [Bacteroidetes bacterium]|nr:hypothetical protein [Bacteroidota bacterium]